MFNEINNFFGMSNDESIDVADADEIEREQKAEKILRQKEIETEEVVGALDSEYQAIDGVFPIERAKKILNRFITEEIELAKTMGEIQHGINLKQISDQVTSTQDSAELFRVVSGINFPPHNVNRDPKLSRLIEIAEGK